MVNQECSLPAELRHFRQAAEHGLLQGILEARRILRRRNEAEGQDALCIHSGKRISNLVLAYSCLDHPAQVTQKCQRSELVLGHQSLERLALIGATRERNLPRIGSLQRAIDQRLEDNRLSLI